MSTPRVSRLEARLRRNAAATLREEATRLTEKLDDLLDEHTTATGRVVRPREDAVHRATVLLSKADGHELAALQLDAEADDAERAAPSVLALL